MEKSLTGSIALTKMKTVITERKGNDGSLVRGVFIPIEINSLEEKDGAVYLPVRLIVRDEKDQYENNGFISKNSKPGNGKKYSELTEDEKKVHNENNLILGNVKEWKSTADSAPEIKEDDDLPF